MVPTPLPEPDRLELRRRLIGNRRLELAVTAALLAWVVVPVIVLAVRPLVHGGVFTGVTGLDPVDEFQYLAWIRDSGAHGLAINLFGLTGGGHVFLQPMWFLSGLLWRLGLGMQVAYLVWVPVAVVALAIGFESFARRHGATRGRRLAILILGLFFATPIGWLNLAETHWVAEMQLGMTDATNALQPWFALHTAIAVGLMPLVLLGAERALSPGASTRVVPVTCAGAAAVCWLHSWQGEALLLVLAGVIVLGRDRLARARTLAPVLVAGGMPLLYQLLLTRTDAAWKIIEQTNDRPDLIVLTPQLAVLGPLLIAAAVGLVRRPPRDAGESMLVLWPIAAVLVYRFNPEFPPHALQGVTLPLATLAVRGWPRGRTALVAGVAGIAAFTLPGLAYFAKSLAPTVQGNRTLFFQTATEHQALAVLAAQHGPGGVLAPYPLSLEVPAFTDRPVWDGHQAWTPDTATRDAQANALFSGALPPAAARRFVVSIGVRSVLADCPTAAATMAELRPILSSVRRIGCAAVATVTAP